MKKFLIWFFKVFCILGLVLSLFGVISFGISHRFSNAFVCSLSVFFYSFALMCLNDISHE